MSACLHNTFRESIDGTYPRVIGEVGSTPAAACPLHNGAIMANEQHDLDHPSEQPANKCPCGGTFERSRGCGVKVCDTCDNHQGLVRCFCGWSADGGDGEAQLREMGENVDEDY